MANRNDVILAIDQGTTNTKVLLIDAHGAAQAGTVGSQLVANRGLERTSGASGVPETPDSVGGPSRTRTLDPLIKRPNRDITPDLSDAVTTRQLELWTEAE